MGFEPILIALVVQVAQKVGDKWIDRVATGIADFPIKLFKEALYDPEKEQEAEDYLRDNPDVGERVGQNVASEMQSPDIAASIAATVVPSSGKILKYYSKLINWIVGYGSKLGRQFVLKGFLNEELCLSYFIFDPTDTGNSDFASVADRGNYVMLPTGTYIPNGIYVEQMRSKKAREEKFKTVNDKARLSSSN